MAFVTALSPVGRVISITDRGCATGKPEENAAVSAVRPVYGLAAFAPSVRISETLFRQCEENNLLFSDRKQKKEN